MSSFPSWPFHKLWGGSGNNNNNSNDDSPPTVTIPASEYEALKTELASTKSAYHEKTLENQQLTLDKQSLESQYTSEIHRLQEEIDAVWTNLQHVHEQRDLLKQQLRTKASERADQIARMHLQVAEQTHKLNSLSYQPHPIHDDEVSQTMKKLNQGIERWVATNFRRKDLLDSMANETLELATGQVWIIDETRNMHERWCLVRAVVAAYLYHHVFNRLVALDRCGQETQDDLGVMGRAIFNECPPHVYHHWVMATSLAGEHAFPNNDRLISETAIEGIESSLGRYASSEVEPRLTTLQALVFDCVKFKQRLDRQDCHYGFFRNSMGDGYCESYMQDLTGMERPGARVMCCLWPGVWKGTATELLIAEKQVVWVQDDGCVEDEEMSREEVLEDANCQGEYGDFLDEI
ncbi:hypothetical protein FE257_010334 [Aspergillus nanangensis]|uniref:Uncharacterized protein n=1 Tax=Aspergillus nanangensis TaxID=2582783 RepID=A0AAD4GRE5_ASPNN|nr:hypothetical protein FE257_010334 [Aspergillus nanangensis]